MHILETCNYHWHDQIIYPCNGTIVSMNDTEVVSMGHHVIAYFGDEGTSRFLCDRSNIPRRVVS